MSKRRSRGARGDAAQGHATGGALQTSTARREPPLAERTGGPSRSRRPGGGGIRAWTIVPSGRGGGGTPPGSPAARGARRLRRFPLNGQEPDGKQVPRGYGKQYIFATSGPPPREPAMSVWEEPVHVAPYDPQWPARFEEERLGSPSSSPAGPRIEHFAKSRVSKSLFLNPEKQRRRRFRRFTVSRWIETDLDENECPLTWQCRTPRESPLGVLVSPSVDGATCRSPAERVG